MIKSEYMHLGRPLPLVVSPLTDDVDLPEWASGNRGWIDDQLAKSAVVLFRGFQVESPARFQSVVQAISGTPLEYKERSSPRSQVEGNIYTSTDYPPSYSIFLHSESSYSSTWPMKVFFCCAIGAAQGGETPVADTRAILRRIDPEIRARFQDKGVMYVRNFGQGPGLSWNTVFQTTDKAQVDAYCRQAAIQPEWLPGDRLRTRHVRPAIATHPRTGESVWFNHAAFFHVSTLDPMIREALLASYAQEDLPNNTYYGDGSPIEAEVLDHIRAAYAAELVAFPWQPQDVMLLDNMLTAHGRAPFKGSRRILVAMAEPIHAMEAVH